MMQIRAIFNRDGGTLRTMDVEALCARAVDIFEAGGHKLDCRIVSRDEVEATLTEAGNDPKVEAIVIGGGDGTVSAAAAQAFKSGKPLGVLPAGTMNLFARALGMPLDLDAALAAIAGGTIEQVDIATANGRPFVHQFGVGIHARLVRIRDGMVYRSRVGKMMASLRSVAAAAVNPPRFEVELNGPGGKVKRTVSGIAVSNNPLDDSSVPVARTLDSGRLGVYLADQLTTAELAGLVMDLATARWRTNALVSEAEVPRLHLHFPRRRRGNHAVIDGELISLDQHVELEVRPGGLAVFRPREQKVGASEKNVGTNSRFRS
ncbi:MAG: diacylglycerol kinase family lipid kinase [Devosia sp.]|uniref:diacylglycerol/lipid kinase family protein n=1 Tax=Devosia sp. TaxID=1871048 RepID=UPI0024CC461E|nr:diacylglycerol kinase family protein [Devosia sp.]UYO01138.1 MAG: diacylglycerol kinase family lipid kinase [Devosia sp.]